MADNGMIDLSDLVANTSANGAAFSTNNANAFGMVDLTEFSGPSANKKKITAASNNGAPLSVEKHSEILTSSSAKSITLTSLYALESTNSDEKEFWSLYNALLTDAERTPSYAPEKIGINLAPVDEPAVSATAPPPSIYSHSRLWYITHYAFLQDLLMRHPKLRLVALILRWLESSYAERYSEYRNYRFAGRAQSRDEVRIMRESIRCALRAGRMEEAIRIAEAADDGITACMITAALMKAHPESWNASTAVVPLFGEYANSDEPLSWGAPCASGVQHQGGGGECDGGNASGKPWTTNKDRLDHLGTLLDWSELSDVEADEAIIAAILSGNEKILADAFDTRRWQDELWLTARCGLVKIFAKSVSANGEPIAAGPFRDRFEAYCPPQTEWVSIAAKKLVDDLVNICFAYLRSNHESKKGGGDATTTADVSLASHTRPGVSLSFPEELQLRLILQTLGGGAASAPSTTSLLFEASYPLPSMPFYSAVNIVSVRAFADRLSLVNPQQKKAGADCTSSPLSYSSAVRDLCVSVITSPRLESKEASRRCCQLLFTISNTAERAKAAAKVVMAARSMNYATYNNTVTDGPAAVTSSTSSPTASPSSRAQLEQRRLFVVGKEQGLLQLFRRFNISRYTADSDEAFVKALLDALSEALFNAASSSSSATSAPPLLAADSRAETQQWRMLLWASPKALYASPSSSATTTTSGGMSDSVSSGDAAAVSSASVVRCVSSVLDICADVRATVSSLWKTSKHYKAITEVMAGYNKYIRPTIDAYEAKGELEAYVTAISQNKTATHAESGRKAVIATIRELTFWSYFATILAAWDALSTVAVFSAEARRDKAYSQLEVYACEEKRLRDQIRETSTKALGLQDIIVSENVSCAGAILKCVELHINAAVVGINFAGQQKECILRIANAARDQVLLIDAAIAVAPQADVAELFACFRMLRLDTGVRRLKSNVAAALA